MARVARLALRLGCVAAAVAPGYAYAETTALASTASINAIDFKFQDPANPGQSTVTIAAGGTVTFAYPSGSSRHNVDFDSNQPTSCAQTAGTISAPVPPLPAQPTPPGWAGACTFNTPGTYSFHCDLHPFMTGTVVVDAPAGTPPPPGNPPPSGSPPPPGNPPPGSPVSGPHPGRLPAAASGVVLTRIQHGAVVHGSINIARGGSRLTVAVLARRSMLGGHGSMLKTVGRYAKTVSAGRRRFSIQLSAAVKQALRRRGRLAVTMKISVKPRSGAAFATTRSATLTG
jgi:plastocyanin